MARTPTQTAPEGAGRRRKPTAPPLLLALVLVAWWHGGAMAQDDVTVEVLVDGAVVAHREVATTGDDGRSEIAFAGGGAALATADVGVWNLAHVLAVTITRQGDGSYRFDTTVRHRDEGWDHYADLWHVVGEDVENGERILLHPHDTEQPFTRSQSGVRAGGVVTIEARDSLHGWGGSAIRIDVGELAADRIRVELRFVGGR